MGAVEVGDWSEVYYIPLDSDFSYCISWENEDAVIYELMVAYRGISRLKHERYHN